MNNLLQIDKSGVICKTPEIKKKLLQLDYVREQLESWDR